MVTAVSQTYIDMIKAFRADCDILIGVFKDEKSKDLSTFLQLWQSLNFNLVYDLTFSKNGMEHDFMNDTLQIAKLIMLHEDFAGGIFLMYGLYFLQDKPLAAIRLELNDFLYILRTLRVKYEDHTVKNNQQIAFAFCVLLRETAFDFVVFGREYDMEGQHRAEMIYNNQYEFSDDENPRSVRPRDWLHNLSQDLPKEMKDLENDYLKLKSKIKAVFPYLNLSLDMVQEDITTTLLRCLTQADSMAQPGEVDANIGARRRSLKNRKMKIKNRYLSIEEEANREELRTNPKKKRGAPKGGRTNFFNKAINDSVLNPSSDTEEESSVFDERPPKPELCFPLLL